MVALKRNRGARKALVVGLLTLAAGLAGYKTEVVAQHGASSMYTFKGQNIAADWEAFDPTAWSSSASFQASTGVTGPGKPNPTATAWANGTIQYNDGSFKQFSAGGDVAPSTVNVKVTGTGADGTANFTVPGSLTYFSWTNGWTTEPVQATVNLTLHSDGVYAEMSRQVFYDQAADLRITSTFKAQSGANPTGSGGISLNDGVSSVDFVPQNTTVWSGGLRDTSQGQHTVDHP